MIQTGYFMKFRKNSKGFTLLSLMMSVAISGIVLASIGQALDMYQKGEAGVTARVNRKNLMREIRYILSDPKSCTAVINNSGLTPQGVNTSTASYTLYDPQLTPQSPGISFAKAGDKFGGYDINRIYFKSVGGSFTTTTAIRKAVMAVEFYRSASSNAVGPSVVEETIDIVYRSNASGVVSECSSNRGLDVGGASANGMVHCLPGENCPGVPIVCYKAILWQCAQPANPGGTMTGTSCIPKTVYLDTGGKDKFRSDNLCFTSACPTFIYWKPDRGLWYYGGTVYNAASLTGSYVCNEGVDVIAPP